MNDETTATLERPETAIGSPGELSLRFRGGPRDGQVLRLAGSKCSIGSDAACTLRLAAAGVHPVHCYIIRGEGGAVVRRWSPDTRLNGRNFRDAPLSQGDRLSVGAVELEVLEAPAAKPDDVENAQPRKSSPARASAEQVRELQKLQQQLREQNERFETQRQVWEAEQARLAGERADFTSSAAKAQSKLATAIAEFEAERRSTLARFEDERRVWNDERQTWTQELQTSDEERTALAASIENLERQLALSQAAHQDVVSSQQADESASAAKLAAAMAEFESQQRAWQSERDAWTAERMLWHNDRRTFVANEKELQELLSQSQADYEQEIAKGLVNEATAAEMLTTAQAEFDALRQTWQAERDTWTAEKDAWQTQRTALQIAEQQLRDQVAHWQSAHEQAIAQSASTEDARVAEIANELAALRDSQADLNIREQALEAAQAAFQAAEAALHAAQTALQADQAAFQADQAAFQAEKAQLDEQAADQRTRALHQEQSIEQRLLELNERAAAFDAQCQRFAAEFDTQKQQLLGEQAQLQAQRQKVEEDLATQKQSIAQDLRAQREQHEQQLQTQREELEAQREQLEAQASQLASREQDLEALQRNVEAQTDELQSQRSAIAAEQATLAGEREQLEDERRQLELRRDELARQSEELTRQSEAIACNREAIAQARDEFETIASPSANETPAEAGEPTTSAAPKTSMPPKDENASGDWRQLREQMLRDLEAEADATPQTTSQSPHAEQVDHNELAEASPELENKESGIVAPAAVIESDELSIDDYMVQLMRPVQGRATGEPVQIERRQSARPMPATSPIAATGDAPSNTNDEPAATPEQVEKLRSLPTRAAAPEQPVDMKAMRALANQTARSAIDTSTRQKWAKMVQGKFVIGAAAGVCGGVTATLAVFDGLFSWMTLCSLVCFGIAGAFGVKGLAMRKQSK